ncbi:MAG TPA: hypothetical protein PLE19_05550 [Planctomycetota bacterium]|nr:hypothetical protein [Planctomycetota bacterium]HRR80200.1 hypothetical protein [Planctomycetota bacterium]HRT93208.1 hypothetical protein [Planctomycetota bacterium]
MPEPVVFRRSTLRAAAGTAGGAALGGLLTQYVGLFPLQYQAMARVGCAYVCGGIALLVLVSWLCVARERLVVGDEALTLRRLLGTATLRWENVAALVAPLGLYTDVPLVLVRRGRPRGLLARLRRPGFALPGHWVGHARLVREIVARAPHAAVNARLRAWLADPRRVPLSHRVAALSFLALAVGLAAAALAAALSAGVVTAGWGVLTASLALPCGLAGQSLGREWRPKSALVIAYTALAAGLFLSYAPGMAHGRSSWVLLLLAGCLGWAVATFLTCLPGRPRAARVVATYAAALTVSLGLAWRVGVREPVPVLTTEPLRLGDGALAWSPDGGRIGVHATDEAGDPAYLVLNMPSLDAHRLPVRDLAEQLHLLNGCRALYLTCRFHRNPDRSLGSTRTLWAWDAAAEAARVAAVPPRLRVASEGLVTPDGSRAVFLGLNEARRRWEVLFVRLADGAVTRLESAFDFSRFGKVRWAPDGGLVLTEKAESIEGRPARIALWHLAPGAAVPQPFYEARSEDIWDRYSPDARWALIAHFRGGVLWERYVRIDLRTREARVVEFPRRPLPHQLVWSPDGAALGYAFCEGGAALVTRYELATAALHTVPVEAAGELGALALSHGGRFAAFTLREAHATRVCVVELDTGRAVFLRRPLLFPAPIEPRWSPAGHTLAVTSYENPYPPDRTVRIRLYDFARGW